MDQPKTKSKKQKKPYHIKRSDLNLDEYKQELLDRSPGHLVRRAASSLAQSWGFRFYLLAQALAAAHGYGQIMFCVGLLWMFYANTGKRKKGEMSAYSIFNENVEAIDGATSAEQLDRELRRQMY